MSDPFDLVLVDGTDPIKGDWREYFHGRIPLILASAAEITSLTLSTDTMVVMIESDATIFIYDSSDTTTVHNGTTCLVDAGNRRYKPTTASIGTVAAYGAIGDGDESAGTGTDNTTAIDAALAVHDDLYLPAGTYKVTTLSNYAIGKRFWGPGVIWATTAFQTPYYGGTIRAGIKIGNTYPVETHGGLLIGGSGPTDHGTMIKAQLEGIIDVIPTRDGDPVQIQLYSNAVQGYGDFTGTTLDATVKSADFDVALYPNDRFWYGSTQGRVSSITDADTLVIKDEDGSAASTPSDLLLPFWSFYDHAEHTMDLVSGVLTRTAGDQIQDVGEDQNVIINGTRYEVSAVDTGAETYTVTSPPGDDTDLTILFRSYPSEEYISLVRWQGLRGSGKEMTLSQFIRADFAGMRIGATGSGTDDYAYYLPFHFLTGRSSEKLQTGGESNMTGEGYTALTVEGQGQHVGKVGVGIRNPLTPLHVQWNYFNSGSADNTTKEVLAAAALWQGGDEHRVSVLQRNADYGGGIQGYGSGSGTKTLCLQPVSAGVYLGGWADPDSGYLFQVAGGIAAQKLKTPDQGPLTLVSNAMTVTGAYHTVIGEGAAADDIDTISGGVDGQILIIQADDDTVTITAKDGVDNLNLAGDFAMDNAQDTLTMIYSGALSAWCEICRSNNGA